MERLRLPLLVSALAVAVVVTACSSSDSKKSAPTRVKAPTTEATLGTVTVERAAGGEFDGGPAIVALVNEYVKGASVQPFVDGTKPADLAKLFTAEAAAAATTTDAATLTDAGQPKPTGTVTSTIAPLNMTALLDADGGPVLVSVAIDQQLAAPVAGGQVTIKRTGEFVLEPCDKSQCANGYRVRSYGITVQRSSPDGTSTTTAVKK